MSTERQEGVNGWKWATVLLCIVLLTLCACLIGIFWGGLLGFGLGQQRATAAGYDDEALSWYFPREYYLWPEMPESDPESQRPWLGVYFETTAEGARIIEVIADSPADYARLKAGDIITAVDGEVVDAAHPLNERIAAYTPYDWVELTYLRNGSEWDTQVILGSRPAEEPELLVPEDFWYEPPPSSEG